MGTVSDHCSNYGGCQLGNKDHSGQGNQGTRTPGLARNRFVRTSADSRDAHPKAQCPTGKLRVLILFTCFWCSG